MTAKLIKQSVLDEENLSAEQVMLVKSHVGFGVEEVSFECDKTQPRININDYLGDDFNKSLFDEVE